MISETSKEKMIERLLGETSGYRIGTPIIVDASLDDEVKGVINIQAKGKKPRVEVFNAWAQKSPNFWSAPSDLPGDVRNAIESEIYECAKTFKGNQDFDNSTKRFNYLKDKLQFLFNEMFQ